jgi:hypothetical protein
MNDWRAAIVADLAAASAELLRPGTAPREAVGGSESWFADPVEMALALAALVPRLLAELDPVEGFELAAEPSSTTMRRPILSRRPHDHTRIGEQWVPLRWLELRPVGAPNPTAIAWLLHVLATAAAELRTAVLRVDRQVAAALATRAGESMYARADADLLERHAAGHHGAEQRLLRAMRGVRRFVGRGVAASGRMPANLPRSPAWSALRRLADVVLRPRAYLSARLRSLFARSDAATLPFLYQRWVGLQLVRACERAGFVVNGDVIGSLFLGGSVALQRDGLAFTLWCEPRLSTKSHPSGLRAAGGEVEPDYVLVFPGNGGFDAYVLDATLSGEQADAKARYRSNVEFAALLLVAGVPVRRHPLRAWAAVPVARDRCDLHASDGSTGTVPMLPGAFQAAPIAAWLHDAIVHATAWSRLGAALPTA